ncbi:hypothetical protein GCM10018791_39650 [Streptomyces zaomyceticus]|nr:hypothetical protein GCM10018791_39650 [Streptomyces zaomyceticus]
MCDGPGGISQDGFPGVGVAGVRDPPVGTVTGFPRRTGCSGSPPRVGLGAGAFDVGDVTLGPFPNGS